MESKEIHISNYKGFDLWEHKVPEGWKVNPYSVHVTCNGQHVNVYRDTNEAMNVIDGMDKDTVAYHMRKSPDAPAPEPEPQDDPGAAADWRRDNEREAFVFKPGRAAGGASVVDGVNVKFDHQDAEMFLQSLAQRDQDVVVLEDMLRKVRGEYSTLQANIETARRELQAARDALEPFAEAWLQVPLGLRSTLRIWNGLIDEQSGDVSLGVSTDDLESAHVAFFHAPKADASQ